MSAVIRSYTACLGAALAVLALPAVAQAGLLSKSSAEQGKVSSAVVSLADLTVGESEAQAGAAKYTYLRVGESDVLTYNSDGTWTGAAADLGPVLHDLNEDSCKPVGDGDVCYWVLFSHAGADPSYGFSSGTLAGAAYYQDSSAAAAVVGESGSTVHPPSSSSPNCSGGASVVTVGAATDGDFTVLPVDESKTNSSC